MSTSIRWRVKPGLPFGKSLIVALPTGRDWWTDLSDFQTPFQVREEASKESNLIADFGSTLAVTFMNADTVRIIVDMDGAHSRLLTESGFFDIIMSSTGLTNEIGFAVIEGFMQKMPIVSKEIGE